MLSNYTSHEPLYLIIVRHPSAESQLRDWAKTVKARLEVDNDRVRLYDQRSLAHFYLNWSHDWDRVIIWDYWMRHHIKL